jgi:hypothetical protein
MRRNSKQERERERAGDAKMFRAWKKYHREERDAVLSGPHARTLAELFRAFTNIECVKPAQLIGFISAIDWSAIDFETRLTTLHEVNAAIVKHREKRGLPPIDDPLPDAPPNAFQVIRKIITEFPATDRGESHTEGYSSANSEAGSSVKE